MTNVTEIWLPIKDYEGYYEVSNHGRIKSLERLVNNQTNGKSKRVIPEKIRAQGIGNHGYNMVCLCINQTSKTFTVHRLVAMAFIENHGKKTIVNHKDGNKQNNCALNLEWVTRAENELHAKDHGLKPKGQRNGSAKISDLDAEYIKLNYKKGNGAFLSYTFGVTVDHILRIANGSSRNR